MTLAADVIDMIEALPKFRHIKPDKGMGIHVPDEPILTAIKYVIVIPQVVDKNQLRGMRPRGFARMKTVTTGAGRIIVYAKVYKSDITRTNQEYDKIRKIMKLEYEKDKNVKGYTAILHDVTNDKLVTSEGVALRGFQGNIPHPQTSGALLNAYTYSNKFLKKLGIL